MYVSIYESREHYHMMHDDTAQYTDYTINRLLNLNREKDHQAVLPSQVRLPAARSA
jgi:hypothetical protein